MFDRAKVIDRVVALAKPKTERAERALRARMGKLDDDKLGAAFKRRAKKSAYDASKFDFNDPSTWNPARWEDPVAVE